jgi:hypothetical protein
VRVRLGATLIVSPSVRQGRRSTALTTDQSSGRAAKSRLVLRYHPIPEMGFFHLPFISFKALSCVSSPLATMSFRWLSCPFMTSSAVFPWSGKSHGPPNCLHVIVFISPASFLIIRPSTRTSCSLCLYRGSEGRQLTDPRAAPRTLPSGSVTVATRRPPPTLCAGSFTVAPADVTSASFASMSGTSQ